MKDDLTSVLREIEDADAFILGSPIYFGDVTGEMRSFLERLLFQYLAYDQNYSVLFQKKMPTAFIYTMNANERQMEQVGFETNFKTMEMLLQRFFGSAESLYAFDTYQFDDYSKYVSTAFDAEEKEKRQKKEFPKDCKKAFEMGARIAKNTYKVP